MKSTTACVAMLLLLTMASIHDARAEPTEEISAVLSGSESDEDLDTFEKEMDMSDVIALFRQQQQELAAQRQLLENQSEKIATLTRELDAMRAPAPVPSEELVAQRQILASQSQKIETLSRELDELRTEPPPASHELAVRSGTNAVAETSLVTVPDVAPEQPKTQQEESVETGDAVSKAQADDPSRARLEDFTGAISLAGTNAMLRVGGYVKTAVVYNFDPLLIKDRFIVGSIIVGGDDTSDEVAQSSITADQSRLNFDLREPTKFGLLRAFIEGDFAGSGSGDGSNDTFRLRHAFGQWKDMLAGKTWSAFMDPEASPEDIDFEGLNGRVNVRQSQVRLMPKLGQEYEFQVSLEDPDPEIQNGSGVSKIPDIVLSARFDPRERLHAKLALIARQIRAQTTSGDVEEKLGWGASLSGRYSTPQLDARDKLLFQLNYGEGIGRYINDLQSVGNYDGIFNPDQKDKLELFDVFAGYVSWQHWWGVADWRSNFTFGYVDLDSPDFVTGSGYGSTMRASANVIWSPTPRVDFGAEYLWGQRENKDGEEGDATQMQLSVKYRF
jgi:hypothetical protein